MQGKAREQWMQLCEQAAVEQDAEKLLALVKEINRMLEEKDRRLQLAEATRRSKSAFLFQFGYFVAEDSSLVNDVEVTGTD